MAGCELCIPTRRRSVRLHFGDDETVAAWAVGHIPHVDKIKEMTTIGVVNDRGKIVGAAVFHEYRGTDIQISCASESPKWISKKVLRAIFSYPFKQLGCRRVTVMTPSKHAHMRQLIDRLGFKQEGILRDAYQDDDCVVYGMLRSECKWIERK